MKLSLKTKEYEEGDGYYAVYLSKGCIHIEDYESELEKRLALRRCMAVISYLNGGERPSFGSWMFDDDG